MGLIFGWILEFREADELVTILKNYGKDYFSRKQFYDLVWSESLAAILEIENQLTYKVTKGAVKSEMDRVV